MPVSFPKRTRIVAAQDASGQQENGLGHRGRAVVARKLAGIGSVRLKRWHAERAAV